MVSTKLASRYAKSLLDLAVEQGKLEEAFKDMSYIDQACRDNKDLVLLFNSPIVKTDKKLTIIDKLWKGKLGDLSLSFIKIITSKKREAAVPAIASSFLLKYKAYKEILVAEVTTASPLDNDLRKKVMSIVEKLNHKEIELVEHVDPELIGGVLLRVGDQQVDASISSKIQELKKEFASNPYVADF